MTGARWTQLWDLFHQAVELPDAERANWLRDQCADDAGLQRELTALLAAHRAGDSPLDRPLPAPALADVLPDAFGPWRVRREIGRGGMGRVLEVERTDGEYTQRAALKLIDPMFASAALRERFVRERQILARLNHPRIARLLDGGRTPEGQPWLVMEYIAGEPIDRWCAAHDADTGERVQLLIEICAAVDFAHRQLVVHRDLKPSNVLVTEQGVPVLLDFGIARSLDPNDTAATALGEQRPLTPRYASPEQLDGGMVGVASDVYSLGVLAFELFAGEPPYEVAGVGWAELAARLRAAEPAALRGTVRGRRLPQELDWICAHALAPDPAHRYPSAQALADDLRASLAHRPLAARAPGRLYRARKFVRRRWPGVLAAAVFAATTAVFIWRLSAETAQTRAALAASELERERTERVAAFLSDLFRLADTTQSGGTAVSARDVLDRGRAQLDARADLPPAPRVLLLNSLAGVYRNMGEYAQAGALLEDARGLLAQAGSPALEAETLENIGALLELAGRSAEAQPPLVRALELRRAALPPSPAAVAQTALRLASTLQTLGQSEAAGALFQEAHAIRSAQLAPTDPARADSALRYGSWFWVGGRLDEAARYYREALHVRRAQQPADLPELARTLDANASLAHAQGGFEQAVALFEEAIALRRRVLGNGHRLTGDSLSNLGACLVDAGRPGAAVPLLREALATYAQVLPADSVVPAKTLNNLGLAQLALGDAGAARSQFQRALVLNRTAYGDRHPRVAGNLNNLALSLEAQDDLPGAEKALRDAIAIIDAAQGAAHASRAFPLTNLGRIRLWQGQIADAQAQLQRALEIRRAALPSGHGLLADTLGWLGLAYCEGSELASAAQALDEALTIRGQAMSATGLALRDLRVVREVCVADSAPARVPGSTDDRASWIAERGADDRLVRWVLARSRTPTAAR